MESPAIYKCKNGEHYAFNITEATNIQQLLYGQPVHDALQLAYQDLPYYWLCSFFWCRSIFVHLSFENILVACPRVLQVKSEQSKANPFGRRISINLGTIENSQ